jgi:hypothetical protein
MTAPEIGDVALEERIYASEEHNRLLARMTFEPSLAWGVSRCRGEARPLDRTGADGYLLETQLVRKVLRAKVSRW